MPKLPEQFIQRVADATDIVELVSQYVSLTRRGKEFIGLCPFHDDKRPSMYVSPDKQIYKCFSCGAGGGVFQFVEAYEKLSFPEAVRMLAERSHIPLPDAPRAAPPGRAGEPTRERLREAMAFATRFYAERLAGPEGEGAMEYALSRGFTRESIERFGLGYAPESWDALTAAARRKGFSERELEVAGLAGRSAGGRVYDRFRHRLMVRIADPQGRPVALGGRALSAEEQAKYLNSPQTPLFDKSGLLFGLDLARDAIVRSGRAIVVEGYFDALMPMQMGVGNVVATMGTALTDRHVSLLRRYARDVVLVFDADEAGGSAADRALEIFLAQQVRVRVATIPAGKDPCDYCLSHGPEALTSLVEQAPDALEYAWSTRSAAYRRAEGDLAARRGIVDDFLRLIATSEAYGAIDDIRRGQLAQHIAHVVNVPLETLQEQMASHSRRVRRASGGGQDAPSGSYVGELSALPERHLLEVLLSSPELFDDAAEKVGPEDFASEMLRPLAQAVWSLGSSGELSVGRLLHDESGGAMGSLVVSLVDAGTRRGNYEATLAGAIEQMLYRRNRREMASLRGNLRDEASLRRFMQRLGGGDVRRRPGIM